MIKMVSTILQRFTTYLHRNASEPEMLY